MVSGKSDNPNCRSGSLLASAPFLSFTSNASSSPHKLPEDLGDPHKAHWLYLQPAHQATEELSGEMVRSPAPAALAAPGDRLPSCW